MGLLTPLFKAAAEKRAAKRRQIYLEEQARYDKRQEKVTSLTKRLTDIVNSYAEDLEKSKCHLKVGDEATLNIYDFDRPTRNGWDGGPTMLLNYIAQKEEMPEMPVFKIESIYVDKSLAFEKIENFLKNIDDYELNVYAMQNNHALEIAYSAYLNSRDQSAVFSKFGLYKTAMFSSPYKFQPSWGLNVYAFLVLGTPAAKSTQDIYRMYMKRAAMWKEHNDFSNEIEAILKQANLDYSF
jgi:hypothetical protein